MKKYLILASITFFAFIFCSPSASAQAPQAIPYQAVARDNTGASLINQLLSLRISIRNLNDTGSIVYRETHTATTNNLGLFNLNIGQGTPVIGTLSAINWANGAKYIQVEMDATGGTNYTHMGTTQLMSVPYALSSASDKWAASGNNITNNNTGKVLIGAQTGQGDEKLYIRSNTDQAGWMNTDGNINLGSWLGSYLGGTGGWLGTYSNHPLHFFTNFGSAQMTIKQNGNVGIDNTNPQAKLDIIGNIKITDGTQGAGKVLTSDLNGVASWNTISETDPQVSSSTTNQIPKWNGSSLSDGIITDNGNRIGIGLINPSNKLHVYDLQPFTTIARFQGPGGWNQIMVQSGNSTVDLGVNDPVGFGFVGTKTPQDFAIRANDGVKILIEDTTGNVGIGNLSPQAKLDIAGNIKIVDGTQGAGKVLTSDLNGLASWNTISETDPQVSSTTNNRIPKWNGTSLADGIITDNGTNIGIGNSTPSAKLNIVGNYAAPSIPNSTNGAILKIYATPVDGINIGKNGGPYFEGWVQSGFGGATLDPLSLQPLGGNVGIGTTNPTAALEINGNIKFNGFHSRNGVFGTSTFNVHNFFWTGSSLQAWVDGVFVGTVSMTSDRRLKDQILPMKENALSRVMQLKPVSFHYKTVEGSIFKENPQIQEGFIADELQEVIPSAVVGEKDAVNAEGQIQPQTLNTTPIISLLTKAIQEQQQQIEAQQKQINELKEMLKK